MQCALRDHDLVELFAEYSGLTREQVVVGVHNYAALNAEQWEACDGATWAERARAFYDSADAYVLDLLSVNSSKSRLRKIYERFGHWDWFERSGQEVLEFGGGLGAACSLFRDLGRRVTYVDIAGSTSRFARWYFERTGQGDIEFVITPQDELVLPEGRQWDFVFSDAVLEHVLDPAPIVDRLARAVRPGGILYLIIDAHNVTPQFPMHRHVYMDEILARAPALQRMMRVLHDGDGLNAFAQPS